MSIAVSSTEIRDIPRDALVSPNIIVKIATLIVVILIFGIVDKAITGGMDASGSAYMDTRSGYSILIDRFSAVGILFLTSLIFMVGRGQRKTLTHLLVFWAAIIGAIFLRLFLFDATMDILVRTLNFIAVIVAATLLVSTPGVPRLFLQQSYVLAFLASALGVALFLVRSPFAYHTDGYGMMFTGLFGQKDSTSTVAAFGFILAVIKIRRGGGFTHYAVAAMQLVALYLASTLSSVLGVLIAIPALYSYRLVFAVTSFVSVTIPVLHPIYGAVATAFGKDPTLTGRTYLWDFGISHAMAAPIYGHGFVHITSALGWNQLLMRDFTNDSFFIPHMHNLWVETFYKFGVIGLAVMIATLAIMPFFFRTNHDEPFLTDTVAAFLPFWLIKAAFILPFLNSDMTAYLWAFFIGLGLVGTLAIRKTQA